MGHKVEAAGLFGGVVLFYLFAMVASILVSLGSLALTVAVIVWVLRGMGVIS